MKNIQFLAYLKHFPQVIKNIFRTVDTSDLNLNINKSQESILVELMDNPDKTMCELKKVIGLEKSSFTRSIEKLEKLAYVVKLEHPSDKRKVRIRLTDDGQKAAKALDVVIDGHLDNILELFSKEEQKELFSALNTVAEFSKKLDKNIKSLKKN